MGTPFTYVYDRFLGKITDDMYVELTPQDTIKDLRRLLVDALPGFEYPRQNLFDFKIDQIVIDESEVNEDDFVVAVLWDDLEDGLHPDQQVVIEKSHFNIDLTSEEINIIAILMMTNWLQRQITSIENIRMKYSGSDFKMTSQANHLAKLQSLLGECNRQSHHMQRLYKRREITNEGTYQSTWYWFGPK